jgi:flagellar biosynthesis protein FlhA
MAEKPLLLPGSLLKRQGSEIVLAIGLLALLVILLAPLPTPILDLLLALNVGMTVLLLLVTLSVKQGLDFSVFPSVLLLITLFRLALNVATTRLILLHGEAGVIVYAFGQFVVGGNLVVGLVIFLILIIIQFVVITKGAGRVSEVAARFTLDAMPGKQMAIDAELNAGSIDEVESRRRRQLLVREAEFYGTMDGASKFVRGDAIAAVVITAINLLGGVIIGLTRGMPLASSVRTYSVLSVGDGLISQIPALIVATASGILVTKSSSQEALGQEISGQFLGNPRPLLIGAVVLLGLALTPGLPKLPFLVMAGGLWFAARRLSAAPAAAPAPGSPATTGGAGVAARPPAEGYLEDFLQSDRAGVEIGARLIPLVDSRRGPGLLDRISSLRRDLARKNGLWVPPVRVRDNLQLEPEGYRILIGGREVARGRLRTDRSLAIDPGGVRLQLEGEATRDPAFGLPARWISDNDRQRAEMAGYTVVDAPNVLITHLGEIVRRHGHELLGREDLKTMIDKVRETSPAVVDDLIPTVLSMGSLHRVLGLLLEERTPISNLVRILESLATFATTVKDPLELAERVRVDLGRTICERFRDEQGRLHTLVLDPRLEVELRRSVQPDRTLALEPSRVEQLILKVGEEARKASARGKEVALLCDSSLRRSLRQLLARALPEQAVVAYQEIPSDLLLEAVAVIRPEDLMAPSAPRPAGTAR